MRFATFALDHAEGTLLAHAIPLPDGVLKKGRVLTAADVNRLRASGRTEVIAARLDADDVPEDQAAHRIAASVHGVNTRLSAPFTGRANIYAERDGLAIFDPAAVATLNAIDERITIATVHPFERVTAGQMLATVKIIPFAVPEATVSAAGQAARLAQITVRPFAKKSVHLILTRLPATKDSVLAKRRAVTRERVIASGGTLTHEHTVAHTEVAIAAAIETAISDGAGAVLIFAASAIVDRRDVVPAGLVAAGGVIERLGMPVDPGNLMLLGSLGPCLVIGIPTCAGSPKLNGFDWVLERIMADVPVTAADIAAMGVGGLLKEIPTRPQPRDIVPAGSTPEDAIMPGRHAARIGALVLAGGRASRMGENKLVAEVAGQPIVRRTVAALLATTARPVIVVTGHESARIRHALDGLDVTFVDNPEYVHGLSTSLKAGLAALPQNLDATFVALGDMPEVSSDLLATMIAAFAPKDGRGIVVPVAAGKRGNPVLWGSRYFADMRSAQGDTGAKHLLGVHAEDIAEVDASAEVLTDIDTPDALQALRERFNPSR